MEPKLIRERLSRMGYKEDEILPMVNELFNLSPEVLESFSEWLIDEDTQISLIVEGFSFSELIENHKLNPIASFLTLDWLAKEPEIAISVIKRGYDEVARDSDN